MVIDRPSYKDLIDYLTSNIEVFRHPSDTPPEGSKTVEDTVEQELGNQIIILCTQHDELETNHRSIIVREVDGIVYDIEQVLSEFWRQPVCPSQKQFIVEFVSLIKNVFDSEIATLLD